MPTKLWFIFSSSFTPVISKANFEISISDYMEIKKISRDIAAERFVLTLVRETFALYAVLVGEASFITQELS